MAEELGLHNIKLIELGTYKTNSHEGNRIINQFERIYSANIPHDTVLKPQASEVTRVQWFGLSDLKNQVTQSPERFTPGLLYCLKTYFPVLEL